MIGDVTTTVVIAIRSNQAAVAVAVIGVESVPAPF
jgi:hypothetical protein